MKLQTAAAAVTQSGIRVVADLIEAATQEAHKKQLKSVRPGSSGAEISRHLAENVGGGTDDEVDGGWL